MIGPGPIPGAFPSLLAYDSTHFVPPLVPAFGPDGVSTFILSLEPGTKTTYSWLTEVISSYDGTEQRISYQEQPSLRIEGQAFMVDADSITTRAALMRAAASGATFLVALRSEEAFFDSVVATVDGTFTLSTDTSSLDWAQVGQRVIVQGMLPQDPDPPISISTPAVIQSVTDASITIDAYAVGLITDSASIMPLVPVLLETQQGFTRYPVTVDMWDLRARVISYGWAGVDAMGTGAQVLTFDAGILPASDLTDDNLIIWDRVNGIDGTQAETLASKADLVDLGGVPFETGGSAHPDWIRPIKLRSSDPADFQWLKAVTRQLRGAQGMFLLPSTGPDLAFNGVPAFGQISVVGDYATWFSSAAHRRLVLTTTTGITQYVIATGVIDNGDGTNTISIDQGSIGTIATISFLEQVRLETDDISLVWDGGTFTCDLVARVVQDTVTITEDVVSSLFAGPGTDNNITFPVGVTNMVRDMYWETGQLQAGSIVNTNGFVPHFRTALVGPAIGTATIRMNGANASGATGGAGFASGSGTLGGGSGTGATGTTGAGAAATAFGFWPTTAHPGLGGGGGPGANPAGAGGGGPSSLQAESVGSIRDAFAALRMRFMTGSFTAISGGAGGSSGGGSGTQPGGGGGAGGGNVVVAAGQYINAQNIVIEAKGGAGGNGTAANCGGGGGGGGGIIAVFAGKLPFPNTLNNNGGPTGTGGGGLGVGGSAGSPGPTPFLFLG